MSLAARPIISVIVPVYNQPESLARCLLALQEQTLGRHRFEVIVVDNGSSDPVDDVCHQFPGTVLLHEPTPGSYRARNMGIQKAGGDYLAFTDADCVPTSTWLEEGVKALEADPEAAILAGGIDLMFEDGQRHTWAELYERVYAFDAERTARKGYAVTANLFTRRQTMEEVGLFDAELLSDGDRQWGIRASARGFRVVYAGEARIRHPARRSVSALASKVRRVVGGRAAASSRAESARAFVALLRPPIRSLSDARAKDLTLGEVGKVFIVASALRAAALVEYGRLLAGGSPRRE